MLSRLSAREREVMLLVVGGLRNKEIASQLDMSEKTVKVHMQTIFRKLAIRNRTMLAVLFAQMLAPAPTYPTARYRGPPMTLANTRAQGVRSLWVVCDLCHHMLHASPERQQC